MIVQKINYNNSDAGLKSLLKSILGPIEVTPKFRKNLKLCLHWKKNI